MLSTSPFLDHSPTNILDYSHHYSKQVSVTCIVAKHAGRRWPQVKWWDWNAGHSCHGHVPRIFLSLIETKVSCFLRKVILAGKQYNFFRGRLTFVFVSWPYLIPHSSHHMISTVTVISMNLFFENLGITLSCSTFLERRRVTGYLYWLWTIKICSPVDYN